MTIKDMTTLELMSEYKINNEVASKLSSYINILHSHNYNHIDYYIFLEEIKVGISKALNSFDNAKGGMFGYVKNGILLHLRTVNRRNANVQVVSLQEHHNLTTLDLNLLEEIRVDVTSLTDEELDSCVEVLYGTPTDNDLLITRSIMC